MSSAIEARHFINGAYISSVETFDLFNPATEELLVKVSNAGQVEVDAAVAAAEAALPAWRKSSSAFKAGCLSRLAGLIRANVKELGELEAQSMGVPVSQYPMYAASVAAGFEHFAALSLLNQGVSSTNTPGFINMTLKEPFGVCGAILPWNVPLAMFAFKVGPAVAAGNTIVVKTSEKAPLTSAYVARLAHDAGFPAGVINVLHGAGGVGGLLSSHMKIRKISFTGSGPTGRKVAIAAASSNLKSVTLELGGKSPAIVFADSDLTIAANACAFSMFRNSGQICAAQSRLYVESSIREEFLKLYEAEWTRLVKHGNPLDLETTQGPLADEVQFRRVMEFIEIGKREGKLAFGGERNGSKGYFIQPTLFTDLDPKARLIQEEIFGPVAVLTSFETEEEVLRLANDTEYGLSSSVFTKDINKALRMAQGIEAGNVSVNTFNAMAFDIPFGGVKGSGMGRELGPHALDAYLESKSVFIKIA